MEIPVAGLTKPLPPPEVEAFKNRLSASGIEKASVVVHMPYLPNLSGPQGELYEKSVKILTEELQRCNALGISYLVIHLGSHMGRGSNSGIDQLVNAMTTANAQSKSASAVMVLLENSAGQRNSIGGTLEELRLILDRLDSPKQFGVCIDTCHLFSSGYDLRTKDGCE